MATLGSVSTAASPQIGRFFRCSSYHCDSLAADHTENDSPRNFIILSVASEKSSTPLWKFMTIFNFYLFNRDGVCIFYKEWRRDKQSGMPKSEEFKLMFGMLLSLRSFAERLSSKDGQQLVRYFKTSSYRMNYMETPTGLKMVMNTDPSAVGIPELIRAIYQIYVDTVMKNPLIDTSTQITSDLFATRVDQLVCGHSSYI
ncbi:hypothetical protein Y032_0583g303 [Ancylostoma ceylanicum]|uniref:Trafficking protein particle complex subunit n=2 Tax=Ancylostoma ceylanicum TaxID=53326 RepID=A0A016WMR5_9BILA|nr:hypothetical protein Y032_0583g303 [Ancylostoma ceylanicum]